MRTSLSALFVLLLSGCASADSNSDAGVDAFRVAPADTGIDSGQDAPEISDAPTFDAPLGPVRSYWRNPTPPTCAQRLDPPRWRVTTDPGPPGSVRWLRSLGEDDFRSWTTDLGFRAPEYRRIAPSLTGEGIASWIFVRELDGENRMLGFHHADGSIAHGSPIDSTNYPRMWVPNAYVIALGLGGPRIFPLTPPSYYPMTPPPENEIWTMDRSYMFGPDIFFGGRGNPMPAWSPITGDMVSFGTGLDTTIGVGVGCVEGNRWFTEIPALNFNNAINYVRPDGDVIVTSLGNVWVLDGETGEPLGTARVVDDAVYGQSAAYQPGCGVLVEMPTETGTSWFWLNDETLERGPTLRLPVDRPTSIGGWSGTPDCGLVASAGTGNMVRLNADGSVRYNIPIPAGVGITIASPPVALEDGGTLLMVDPPGWMRLDATGGIVATERLETRVGLRSAVQSVLAPDGTMYFMTRSGPEIRFGAASTGAIPGPYLWPHSGLNWARTNSILPD